MLRVLHHRHLIVTPPCFYRYSDIRRKTKQPLELSCYITFDSWPAKPPARDTCVDGTIFSKFSCQRLLWRHGHVKRSCLRPSDDERFDLHYKGRSRGGLLTAAALRFAALTPKDDTRMVTTQCRSLIIPLSRILYIYPYIPP